MEKCCENCKYSYFTWNDIAEHIDDLVCTKLSTTEHIPVTECGICYMFEMDEEN